MISREFVYEFSKFDDIKSRENDKKSREMGLKSDAMGVLCCEVGVLCREMQVWGSERGDWCCAQARLSAPACSSYIPRTLFGKIMAA